MEREDGFSWDSGRLRPHGPMENDPGSYTVKVNLELFSWTQTVKRIKDVHMKPVVSA